MCLKQQLHIDSQGCKDPSFTQVPRILKLCNTLFLRQGEKPQVDNPGWVQAAGLISRDQATARAQELTGVVTGQQAECEHMGSRPRYKGQPGNGRMGIWDSNAADSWNTGVADCIGNKHWQRGEVMDQDRAWQWNDRWNVTKTSDVTWTVSSSQQQGVRRSTQHNWYRKSSGLCWI